MFRISVHGSTIRGKWKKYSWEWLPRVSVQNMEEQARLRVAKLYLSKSLDFRDVSGFSNLFGFNGQCHDWWKPDTAFQRKHLTPTAKHDGVEVMLWSCFLPTGPGHFVVIESTMNSSVYQFSRRKCQAKCGSCNRKWSETRQPISKAEKKINFGKA